MTDVTVFSLNFHIVWTKLRVLTGRGMLRAIEWYQGQRAGYVSPCRFYPTCSVYAHEAITEYGPSRGAWLAVRRLSRCRPFGPSGYDPVPEPMSDCEQCRV